MAKKKLLNPVKRQAQLDELLAHHIAMNLVTSGATVLQETFDFTQEQVAEWATLTAEKAKGKVADG